MKRRPLHNLRAIAIEPTYLNLRDEHLNVADVVSLVSDVGANCIRLGALSHSGRAYYPSRLAPHAPALRKRDLVGEFAAECDKRDIVLGIYSNAAYVEKRLARNPDWVCRPCNEPLSIGEGKHKFVNQCHHSPYYDFWLQVTREIVARYQPAFYYIDCFQLMPGCTCPFCRRRLKHDLDISTPPGKNPTRLREYLRWVEKANLSCARRAFDAVRETHDKTLVLWNRGTFWGQAGYFPEEARVFSQEIGHGYHTEAAVRFYAESFSHIDEQTLIADAVGRPVFTWVEYPRMPWSHLSSPPVEAEIKAAKVFANGARPMLWSLPAAPLPDLRGLAGVKRVYKLAEKYPDLFDNTTLIADTSILFSTSTSRWYPRMREAGAMAPGVAPCADYQNEFRGQLEAMLRAHVPARVVLEAAELKGNSVLILPNTACMSSSQCERVRRFVRNGGGLVASYETSLYDENGKKRRDFALADVLGVRFVEESEQVSSVNPGLGGGWTAAYMQLTENPDRLFGDLPAGFRFPVGGKTLHVRPCHDARALAQLLQRTRYYCDFPGRLTEWPGVVAQKFGKGHCIYMPWQIGRSACDHGLHDVEALIAASALFVRRGPPLLETDLPATVTVTCRSAKSGDILVHIVNLSCDARRDVHTVTPVHGAKISLRLTDVAKARALVAGKSLKIKPSRGSVEIPLPPIGPHEVIHLALRQSRRHVQ